MTERNRRLGAAALVLALVGAALWWRNGDRPPTSTGPEAATDAAPAAMPALAEDGRPDVRERPRTTRAMPAANAPLPDIAASLEARADQGDSQAACRLAVELMRCRELHRHAAQDAEPDGTDPAEPALQDPGEVAAAQPWVEERTWRVTLRQQCARLPASLHARTWQLLRGAALAGEPEAMLRYASMPEEGMGEGHAFLRHPGFDDWRREAPRMVQRRFRSGDRDALLLLILTSMGNNSPLAGILPDEDPTSRLAYRLLSSRLRAVGPPPLDQYNAAQIAQASRQAADWHRDYFGGRIVPEQKTFGTIGPLAFDRLHAPAPCE